MFLSRQVFACGLSAAYIIIPASAVEPGGAPVRLDPVSVTSPRDASATVPGFSMAAAGLAQVPGGVEAIDAARYLRGRVGTVEDTFALSPGVIAQSRFGADEARMSIRGSGLQRTFHGRGIRVLQDGVPINLADGSFDMQAIEPLAAQYITVRRGANAPGVGASTLGGVIDYISRTARHSDESLRLELGSWDYRRAAVSAGVATDLHDIQVTATHHGQDGFRDHARQSTQRVFANAGWRFSDDAETRLYVTGVLTDSELPGNLTRAQLENDPRAAAVGNVALDQKRDFHLLRVASKTAWSTGNSRWNVLTAWTHKDLDHPIFQVIDQRTNDLLLGLDLNHEQDADNPFCHFHTGVLFTHGRIDASNFANVGGHRGTRLSSADQTAWNLEATFEQHLEFAHGWSAFIGASAAVNRRDSDGTFGAAPDYSLRYERWMPRVGIRWDTHDVQFFANITSTYEPPSFSEAWTAAVARNAQTGTSMEIGTRGMHGPLRWDLTAYRATLRGELLSLDHDRDPSTPAATVNADRTLHQGIEAAITCDLLGAAWEVASTARDRLVVRAAWTHGAFRFRHDRLYGDNTLPGLPPHLLRCELMWEDAAGWYVGPTCEWVPEETWIDFQNTFAARPHTLIGFRAGFRNGRFGCFVDARNLTDRRYAATTGVIENAQGGDQAQFLPGDGRSWFGGVEWAF